jgi:hypothetical protein
MTKKIISRVQEFLTIIQNDGDKIYQIVNIELLLRKHPPSAVISFLQELKNDYRKQLKQLLSENVSNERINELVAKNFRIKMAIATIRNNVKQEDKAA